MCSCICSLSCQNCEAHQLHICPVREISLLISTKNFKLSNVKDPSLSFQFLHKNSSLFWAIKILSCKNQMKILNNLHIRMISKFLLYQAPRVILHEILFMDSFLFYFTVKTSLTSVRWSTKARMWQKDPGEGKDLVIGHESQV